MAKTRSAAVSPLLLPPSDHRSRSHLRSRRRRFPFSIPHRKQRLCLQKRRSHQKSQHSLPASPSPSSADLLIRDPSTSNRNTSRDKSSSTFPSTRSAADLQRTAVSELRPSLHPCLTHSEEEQPVTDSKKISSVSHKKSRIKRPPERPDVKQAMPKRTISTEVHSDSRSSRGEAHSLEDISKKMSKVVATKIKPSKILIEGLSQQHVSGRSLRNRPSREEAHLVEVHIAAASSNSIKKEVAHPIKSRLVGVFSGGINKENIRPRNTVFQSEETTKALDEDENIEDVKNGKGSWTSEQDSALQNAYFQVLPSSNFWFEVSKKVTGKTAKECFDRFYSSYPTPPATKCRSRKSTSGPPMRTISFPSPKETLHSKHHFGKGKQGLLKAHQTVRHILRKQKVADENYEADVFSAVEQDSSLHDGSNFPDESPCVKRWEVSHSNHSPCPSVKLLSNMSSRKRDANDDLKGSMESFLQSPEVLKSETNPRRLDRYLDMLLLRKNRKKGTIIGETRAQAGDRDCKKNEARVSTDISTARDAIIIGAKEVLQMTLKGKAVVEDETDDESYTSDDADEK